MMNYLNQAQTQVTVADKPLFTLAKKQQCKFQETELAKAFFLVTLGPVHTEDSVKLSDDWLEKSGWTTAITKSDIAKSDKAN